LCATSALSANALAQVMPADGTGATSGGVEAASYTTSGSYFNRELGTPLRFGYHSEGYGTDLGVVSLGSMKVFNLDGATWFLDGQGTMSDAFGGGFNVGAGYRELVNMSHGFDPDRILGASFWTDGQSTRSDNFFTQLGFGLESLGESVDFRMNGYFPLSRTKNSDPTLIDRDTIRFHDNGLFAGINQFTTDTAYSVIDAEGAKRIANLDAWATAGVYYLGGGGADDAGFRIGVRGYAVPDLLVGVQVTDDDIYNTNVMATLTWFVGRTHKGNAPIGTIVDRFREPVMRNDFIATTSKISQTAGVQLRDADTNDFFNFIHVDSNAAAGGDGTFENPYNNLAQAEATQADGSYVYMHGGSEFNPTADFQLLDNVKFWGEGTNQFGDVVQHQVDTVERGTVVLPETSDGAEDKLAPIINGFGLILADNNDVNNVTINNATNAIVGNGVNAPQLANLDINGPTGTGISFTDITGTAVVENTVTITDANTGMLIHGGSAGMNINARITNSIGSSLIVENRSGGTIAYGGSIQDDNAVAATAEGIIIRNNTGNTIVNFTQTIGTSDDGPLGININSGNFNALLLDDNLETTTVTFADLIATANDADTIRFLDGGTLTINDSDDESLISNTGTGDAFHHEASAVSNMDSTITVAANIENSGGGNAVDISNHTENNITFSGEITDTDSEGIVLTNNSGGAIAFNNQVTITNSGTGDGVTISGGGADVSYSFADIDIRVSDGIAFSATGDGTLTVTSADGENVVQSETGEALLIEGLAIGTDGAIFDEVNVTNGTTDSVVLRDLDGTGQVRLGPSTGTDSGGIIGTSGTGIVIDNAANVAVNNIEINKTGAGQAMQIINQPDAAAVSVRGVEITATGAGRGVVVGGAGNANLDGNTVTFNELVVNTVDGDAVAVENNTGGTYIFNDLTAATSGVGDAVHIADNSDDTVITFNDMDLDATGTGDAFSAENGGELAATGDTTIDAVSGRGVYINNMEIGSASARFGKVNVTNAATNGVVIQETDGTGLVTIGSGTTAGAGGTITSAGDAILIDNANNVAITRVTVANDAAGNSGNGLVIQNQDGGTVSVTGLTTRTRDGAGIVVQNNSDGTNIFSNSNVNVTGTGNGVTLDSNTGATNSFNTLAINATSGTGFSATGGGTVTASGTNTVTTTTGTGVNMNGVEIGAAGFGLNSVNVNGAVNGVVLTNITGSGTYRQGPATASGTAGAGGTLATTGDSIVLNGVTNAVFNDVTANSSAGRAVIATHTVTTPATIVFDNLTSTGVAGSLAGVELVDNGTGELDFTLRNSTIDMTASNTNAFFFNAGNNSGEVDVRLEDNALLTGDAIALRAAINQGTGNVQFLITGNTVDNTSTSAAVDLNVQANRTLNATVGSQGLDASDGNAFTNGSTGLAFAARTTGGASRINLDLQGNTGTSSGAGVDFELTRTSGQFGVVKRDDTFNDLLNSGDVAPGAGNVVSDFIDLTGPITQPD
jgi:hypothetical protein